MAVGVVFDSEASALLKREAHSRNREHYARDQFEAAAAGRGWTIKRIRDEDTLFYGDRIV